MKAIKNDTLLHEESLGCLDGYSVHRRAMRWSSHVAKYNNIIQLGQCMVFKSVKEVVH